MGRIMNCQPCKDQNHARCIDIYWGPPLETGEHEPTVVAFDGATVAEDFFLIPGRRYRSCFCMHRPVNARRIEPATGPVGE